jgi:lactoylglutathione lyase
VRDLQRHLKAPGLQLASKADENAAGPAAFVIMDPDGNRILADQHV